MLRESLQSSRSAHEGRMRKGRKGPSSPASTVQGIQGLDVLGPQSRTRKPAAQPLRDLVNKAKQGIRELRVRPGGRPEVPAPVDPVGAVRGSSSDDGRGTTPERARAPAALRSPTSHPPPLTRGGPTNGVRSWESGQLVDSGMSEHRTGEDKCPGCRDGSYTRMLWTALRGKAAYLPG